MSRIRAALAIPVTLAIALAVFAGTAPRVSAGQDSMLVIHHRLCPVDQVVDDVFEDCHDRLANQSFDFFVTDPGADFTITTDAATGNGSGSLNSGDVHVSGGVPGEFATTFVYCSVDQVALEVTETATGVSFVVPPDSEVICDWYNTPIDLSGDDDDDNGTGDDDDDDVTQLPNTGVGASTVAFSTGFAAVAGLLALLGIVGGGSISLRRNR